MTIEIALGIVLAVLLLCLLPFALVIALYLFLGALIIGIPIVIALNFGHNWQLGAFIGAALFIAGYLLMKKIEDIKNTIALKQIEKHREKEREEIRLHRERIERERAKRLRKIISVKRGGKEGHHLLR